MRSLLSVTKRCGNTKLIAPNQTIHIAGIITPHRLVEGRVGRVKGFLGGYTGESRVSASSILLENIVGVQERRLGNEEFQVDVKGHGDNEIEIYFGSRQSSLKFVSVLNKAIEQARIPKSQSQVSPADRLRELQKLYDERLISDAEYQQKRKDILGQL